MFEEAKKSVDHHPIDAGSSSRHDNQPASNRRRAITNKKNVGEENSNDYMDYLLTVAEERHQSHLVSKATDIRYSVKDSFQRFFTAANKTREEEPIENREDFEIAPTLGVKGNTDNASIK